MKPENEDARAGVFLFMVDRTRCLPNGKQGAIAIVVTAYLLGIEDELHQAAKSISNGPGVALHRRTEFNMIGKDRNISALTVTTILAIRMYLDVYCPSEPMHSVLNLLMSLAVDNSEEELTEIAERLVVEAALADADLWDVLEKNYSPLCRLIESIVQ
jgi:hypothetical protein